MYLSRNAQHIGCGECDLETFSELKVLHAVHRITSHLDIELCSRFIDQVDSFVRKEAISDVAMTQLSGGNESGIL